MLFNVNALRREQICPLLTLGKLTIHKVHQYTSFMFFSLTVYPYLDH